MRTRLAALLCATMLIVSALSFGTETADEQDARVKRDLWTALALEGVPCDEVVSYEVNAELDTIAHCDNKKRYRLHADDEGHLLVDDMLSTAEKMLRPLLTPVMLVRGSVTGLLGVFGSACEEVLGVESDGSLGQLISCRGGVIYHIIVRENGRVELVEE